MDDNVFRPSPQQAASTPYFYPGGTAGGVTAPAGWYSTPWWRTAATAVATSIVLLETVQRGLLGS